MASIQDIKDATARLQQRISSGELSLEARQSAEKTLRKLKRSATSLSSSAKQGLQAGIGSAKNTSKRVLADADTALKEANKHIKTATTKAVEGVKSGADTVRTSAKLGSEQASDAARSAAKNLGERGRDLKSSLIETKDSVIGSDRTKAAIKNAKMAKEAAKNKFDEFGVRNRPVVEPEQPRKPNTMNPRGTKLTPEQSAEKRKLRSNAKKEGKVNSAEADARRATQTPGEKVELNRSKLNQQKKGNASLRRDLQTMKRDNKTIDAREAERKAKAFQDDQKAKFEAEDKQRIKRSEPSRKESIVEKAKRTGSTAADKAGNLADDLKKFATETVDGTAANKAGNAYKTNTEAFKQGVSDATPKPAASASVAAEEPTTRIGKARKVAGDTLSKLKMPSATGVLKGGAKLAGKASAAVAPGMALYDALSNPEEFQKKVDKISRPGESSLMSGINNSLQFLADTGNNATFGLAGKLGEMGLNAYNGQGFNTNARLEEQRNPQTPEQAEQQAPNSLAQGAEIPNDASFEEARLSPNARALVDGQIPPLGIRGAAGGNFVAPVGPGSNLPFGRTEANQAQIDANVERINQQTADQQALRSGGRNSGLSPEQKQIVALAKSIRTGNIGDKQRNNGIKAQIAALQGVDASSIDRSSAGATQRAALTKYMLEQQNAKATATQQDNIRRAALFNQPGGKDQLERELVLGTAEGVRSPSDTSVLNMLANEQKPTLYDLVTGAFTGNSAPRDVTTGNMGPAPTDTQREGNFVSNAFGVGSMAAPGGNGLAPIRNSSLSPNQQMLFKRYLDADNR